MLTSPSPLLPWSCRGSNPRPASTIRKEIASAAPLSATSACWAPCLGRFRAQEIHLHRQERQALAQVVVQLTRDPPGFVLLGLEQPAGLGRPPGPLHLGLRDCPFDELSDLPPDRIEHLEERVVRFTDLRAEELHDAQKSAGAHNGKPERAVKPINCRARGSGKVRVPYDVNDPRGPS